MTRTMRDFTHGELQWIPWITPVDLDAASPEQLIALKVTPSNRAVEPRRRRLFAGAGT
jgi:hypothetical protein